MGLFDLFTPRHEKEIKKQEKARLARVQTSALNIQPAVIGAETLDPDAVKGAPFEQNIYRLGGNSCLSGDYMGSWKFERPLSVGDRVVFKDMIHYTTVKTNMFNGISHPSIAMLHADGRLEMYKVFGYEDYRDRMC